jgi:DNA-binding XRE family transcriptional regulator
MFFGRKKLKGEKRKMYIKEERGKVKAKLKLKGKITIHFNELK